MIKLPQEIFNFWSLIFQILAAGALIYFAYRQYQINKRLKDLADYVAISIIPGMQEQLRITNVGRVNLYLHKWEIGSLSETYVKPWLLPTEGKSEIIITLSGQIGQHLAKFYLTDETDQKYLSSGEVVIEPIAFQLPISTTPPQVQEGNIPQASGGVQPISVQLRMRAWSYKTEKYNWTI